MNEVIKAEFYTANDVSTILGISRASAYRTIDRLNRELEKKDSSPLAVRCRKSIFTKECTYNHQERSRRGAPTSFYLFMFVFMLTKSF